MNRSRQRQGPTQLPPERATDAPANAPAGAPAAATEPTWDYALSAGNAMALSLVAGNVGADDETAGSLLRGTTDVASTGAPGAPGDGLTDADFENAPRALPVAPETTNPGGTLDAPFQKHEKQVPAAKLVLTPSQKEEIKIFQDNWIKNKGRYQAVAAKTGVPAELIAAIHYRESSLDFGTYLHQGDPLGKQAVNVPNDIPIFYDWEEAAVHALNMKKGIRDGLSMTEDTTDETAFAAYGEAYNGLGYFNRDRTSPYVYAGTDQYAGGMYVSDHKFSNVAKDRRLGVLALTRSIDDQGPTDVAAGAAQQDKRSATQVWAAVLSGHVLRRGEQGREVEALQERLAKLGYAVSKDGDFGVGTDKAVKAFQKANQLTPDGIVGPGTASAIDRGAAVAEPATGGAATGGGGGVTTEPTPSAAPGQWYQILAGRLTLERGAAGDVVSWLQSRLTAAGFPLQADGQFGSGTMSALRGFQRSRGLRADGIVGAHTAEALA